MPTVQQLPIAAAVNPSDELLLDQSGVSVSASVAQLLAAGSAALTLTGDVTGSGTGTIVTTLAPVATPGTFSKVTVNAKGQVTGGGTVAGADVVSALGYTPYSSANPAGYATPASLARVASTGSYADLTGTPGFGTLATQNAGAVAITGGTIGGVDFSGVAVQATGSPTARTLAARAADRINVLDYGADPTGVADSAPAFVAAMASVPTGGWGKLIVPAGTYRLNSFINQPSGKSVSVEFLEGAVTTGGGLGVDRVESRQGPFSLWQGGGGYFGFSPAVGAPQNYAFNTQIIQNTPGNSGASRIAWSRNYANYNYYGKYAGGIDFAEQNIYSWPHTYDNTSGWGHWEVILGTTFDEDSANRAHISASAEHSEYDIVNNGPEAGWTFRSGQGNAVQGMSMDPWGQNGLYGGNILYAYGSVGSFDGQNGGINQRWPSYPAVFSAGNPNAVPQGSNIVITFDATAHATASVSGGGVTGVSVSVGGGIYTSAPVVTFTGGGGSGASGTPVMLGGAVVGVTITAAGVGYTSAPVVGFSGGGVAAASPITVTLNADGAHGDLASVAATINAVAIPNVRASVAQWGGTISRLVVFGIAHSDLGTLTLGGSALGTLGIAASAYSTLRDSSTVVFGGTGGVLVGDQLTINGTTITVGGAGTQSDVISAINSAGLVGIRADSTATGRLVLTAFMPQNPGGLALSQPGGFTTLGKLGLVANTFWPPTPPKGYATAYGELSSPICRTSDQMSIAATDLNGTVYGPVTVTLSGGAGTGWPLDVAASIQAALISAGWYSAGLNTLSAPPAVVSVNVRGSGGGQGILIRNTAGGSLTLANVTGTPLATLGLVAGTYQPGGVSAGSQSVFMAAEDSIAAQGRGIFLGGASTATDRTVWPHTPLEARGSFLHGLRTDKAVFDDNTAVMLGATQAIGFGTGSGAISLTNASGSLAVNGSPVALASSVPSHLSQLANDAGYVPNTAIPAGAGALLGGTATAGAATTITLGANLTLFGGMLSATGGGTGSVTSVVAGAGLAGGTINAAGTISLATLPASSLLGNAAASAGLPGAVTIGSGVALSTAGTLSNAGVLSLNSRSGAVTLGSADVTGALGFAPYNATNPSGYLTAAVTTFNTRSGSVTLASADVTTALGFTPLSSAGGSLSGTLTSTGTISGGTLAGVITNAGTISGGSLAGTMTAAGTLNVTGTATATTQGVGDNSTKLASTAYVYQATATASTIGTTGGTNTLTAAQYATPIILAAGALTANAVFVMPASGVWTVANRTTGAFTLTVKTAAGSGVVVDQGYSAELIADGTNVVLSTTDFNGITLQGAVTNAGTISGGTLGGTVTASGTLAITGVATAATQAAADNSTKLATTGFVFQATAGASSIVTTGGSTTLTAAQYGAPVLLATGALTANATFVVPNNGVWTVANRTSGAFTLTVKTGAGTGVVVDQGYSVELFADGTNVVLSTSDFSGITLQGSNTNTGTLTGGTVAPTTLVVGTAGSAVTVSQTLDAGGYHPVLVKTSGTNTNVPLVLAPAGSGYIATALSDGTSANGNQRGQYAVDLQQSRAANTQVASGAYAAMPGGANNTAGGNYSVAMGQSSTATGTGSVALGQFANDGGAYGKLVFSGNASAVGNQFGVSTLFVSSVTTATRLTSDGAAAGVANSVPIRSNHVIAGTLTVAARNVSNGDGAYWTIPVLFKNSAGTVSVTSPGSSGIAPTSADASLSTASIAIAADNANKALSVTITPPASTTLNASAVFLAAEM